MIDDHAHGPGVVLAVQFERSTAIVGHVGRCETHLTDAAVGLSHGGLDLLIDPTTLFVGIICGCSTTLDLQKHGVRPENEKPVAELPVSRTDASLPSPTDEVRKSPDSRRVV
jgi:hypothetical protein